MIVDDIINVNDWVNEADDKKLNQDVEQNYNEVASEIIRADNPDLLSLILEKTTAQKEHESKQLAEKIQPGLDGFLMIMKQVIRVSSGEDQSVLLN